RGALAHGPADAALDQLLEAGVAPGALVMAPGRVKDPALALCPYPGPRLLFPLLLAIFQHNAILLVVPGVDVGLVPALETLEPLHDRVFRLGRRGAEGAG